AGPGQVRADLDGGEVHVGQVAHRELRVGEHAEDEDRRHQQRGGDGTADEQLGDAHGRPRSAPAPAPGPTAEAAAPGAGAPLGCTRAPGVRFTCPSTTTVSPVRTPWSMTASVVSAA